MELSVGERLVVLSILPKEGDFLSLKLVRELQSNLSFSEEEHKKYQFVQEENSVHWNNAAEDSKDVPMGDKAKEIIKRALTALNDKKQLRFEHMGLYEKFVGTGE